jgi:hypothetical protein
MSMWTGRRPRRFWPCRSLCRCGLAILCSIIRFCIFSFGSAGNLAPLICSRLWQRWPEHSSNGNRRPLGSNFLWSLDRRERRRIVSVKRSNSPCIVCLESCRIKLLMPRRFGIVVGKSLNAILSLFYDHTLSKLRP